ncbi:MAG: hypothetical protein M1827_001144 [Pycnora praestabilis]|nr:MAG: hypothetical protein M1827_001144 [Pycnora praestabilis]
MTSSSNPPPPTVPPYHNSLPPSTSSFFLSSPPSSSSILPQNRSPKPSKPALQPRSLPPEISIEPCTTQTQLHALKRINSLLLPIRYPDKFYTEILTNEDVASLTKVAVWREKKKETVGNKAKRKREEIWEERDGSGHSSEQEATTTARNPPNSGKVIGGIRCRLDAPTSPSPSPSTCPPPHPTGGPSIYIQTLTLLSAHRQRSIAHTLLHSVIRTGIRNHGATSIYAHVWEMNTEALEWYVKRGFRVGEVRDGYYRRLRPGGARVVWRGLGVGEWLAEDLGRKVGVGAEERTANGGGGGEDEDGGGRVEDVGGDEGEGDVRL